MVKLLMIMQHITLCIPCIAFVLVSHTCVLRLIMWGKDARSRRSQHQSRTLTLSRTKASTGASNPILGFVIILSYFIYDS
jgi:hypothetical protein